MSDVVPDAIWYPVMMLIVGLLSVVPGIGKDTKRLQAYFQGSEAALRRAIYFKGLLPNFALAVVLLGLSLAQELNGMIWSWVVGFTCLFLGAGLYALLYTGPLYPLFAELEEAEARARATPNLHTSLEGSN